ncbi:MAG: hypothetical protein WC947_00500 [Elusimicrobiota bacterium]
MSKQCSHCKNYCPDEEQICHWCEKSFIQPMEVAEQTIVTPLVLVKKDFFSTIAMIFFDKIIKFGMIKLNTKRYPLNLNREREFNINWTGAVKGEALRKGEYTLWVKVQDGDKNFSPDIDANNNDKIDDGLINNCYRNSKTNLV